MIKRKVNSQNRKVSQDSEYSEYYESNNRNNINIKKNLEDVYSNLVKNLENVNQVQKDLEEKISIIEEKNENFYAENQNICEEIIEKKTYTKNLEILVLLILDYARMSKENNSNSERNENSNQQEKENSNQQESTQLQLTNFSNNLMDEEKAFILRNVIEEMNENVIRTLLDKSLMKYNLKFEDINFKAINQSSNETRDTTPNNKHAKNLNPNAKKHFDTDTNLSSPTSLISTNEGIFNNPYYNRLTRLMSKRKRTDESSHNDHALNLNQKEKESMFEEVNGLTPNLISSPNMSPQRMKRSDQFGFRDSQSIFTNTHKTSVTYNPDSFYAFSMEDNKNTIVSETKNTNQQ